MLIQRNGGYYGSVPVRLSLHSKGPGAFVMVGDESFRILLNHEEIQELFELLRPFVEADRHAHNA